MEAKYGKGLVGGHEGRRKQTQLRGRVKRVKLKTHLDYLLNANRVLHNN